MLLQFFKALAHESRLRLLGLVAAREHSVQELAELVALKEPTVSHHLAMLREAGLVRLRPDGNTHWYGLDQKALSRFARAHTEVARVSDSGRKPWVLAVGVLGVMLGFLFLALLSMMRLR